MASLREGDLHGAKLGQLECKSVHLQVPRVYSCRCFLAGSHAGHRTLAGNVLVEVISVEDVLDSQNEVIVLVFWLKWAFLFMSRRFYFVEVGDLLTKGSKPQTCS